MGNKDIRRCVEGRGMKWLTWGYIRWILQGLSGRKAGNLKEVGLRWINRGRKDRGFGWGMIRGGGEQLFCRPGGKNGIEESVGVYSKGGKKEE